MQQTSNLPNLEREQTPVMKPVKKLNSATRIGAVYSLMVLGLCAAPSVLAQDNDFSLRQVIELESAGKHQDAIEALTAEIDKSPEEGILYYWRGRSAFCVGDIEQSKNDFDRFIELEPDAKPRQWERGITLYYAKDYQAGAEQFEIYQTYHDNDVENSVWKYLCVAKAKNVEAARDTMLPIRNDRRVPMMDIYRMFRGEASPEDVMKAADAEAASEAAKQRQQFYANLYVGLYFEAEGENAKALEFLKRAKELRIDHYMWNVADVAVKVAESRE